jgi:hypothetical protein
VFFPVLFLKLFKQKADPTEVEPAMWLAVLKNTSSRPIKTSLSQNNEDSHQLCFFKKTSSEQSLLGIAESPPGWARGPGRHGGGAPAMCVGPLMSVLIFRFLFIKKKEENFQL